MQQDGRRDVRHRKKLAVSFLIIVRIIQSTHLRKKKLDTVPTRVIGIELYPVSRLPSPPEERRGSKETKARRVLYLGVIPQRGTHNLRKGSHRKSQPTQPQNQPISFPLIDRSRQVVQIKEGDEKEGARVPAFLMPIASVSTPGPHGQISDHRCPEELGEGCVGFEDYSEFLICKIFRQM